MRRPEAISRDIGGKQVEPSSGVAGVLVHRFVGRFVERLDDLGAVLDFDPPAVPQARYDRAQRQCCRGVHISLRAVPLCTVADAAGESILGGKGPFTTTVMV